LQDIDVTHPGDWDSTALNGMGAKEIVKYILSRIKVYEKLNFYPKSYNPFKSKIEFCLFVPRSR